MSRDQLWFTERTRKRSNMVAGISAQVIVALSIVVNWGNWPAVVFSGVCVFVLWALNTWLNVRLTPRFGPDVVQTAAVLVNYSYVIIQGHLTHWALPVWLWLPYHAVFGDDYATKLHRIRLGVAFVITTIIGITEGAPPVTAISFLLLAALCFALAETRVALIRGQHLELQRAHAQLESMQQQLLRQEKLSTIGLLAAGVAHEINNPMSFVTSNLSCLVADLKDHGPLPEWLQDYRDDVLPASLIGVERVNAIVSDLRRYASLERATEERYDLNAQIDAACRIAGMSSSGYAVTAELDGAPLLVGRPRETMQAIVSLVVQAAKGKGANDTMTVCTRLETDGVHLFVRDGAGARSGTLVLPHANRS